MFDLVFLFVCLFVFVWRLGQVIILFARFSLFFVVCFGVRGSEDHFVLIGESNNFLKSFIDVMVQCTPYVFISILRPIQYCFTQ